MRIIAGKLGGRAIHEPRGHKTHPMSEKIRGALFNALGDIEGLTFLDAFAGSGALSFEAISRGAKHSTAVERDKSAYSAIQMSLKDLGLSKDVKAIKANVAGWSIHNMERQFDLVLLDPPHDDLDRSLLQKLINRHIRPKGLVVLSWPGHEKPPGFDVVKIVENKNYGDAQLIFYRKV